MLHILGHSLTMCVKPEQQDNEPGDQGMIALSNKQTAAISSESPEKA